MSDESMVPVRRSLRLDEDTLVEILDDHFTIEVPDGENLEPDRLEYTEYMAPEEYREWLELSRPWDNDS